MRLTLTKQGIIKFDEYIKDLTKVRLISASVYNMFNLTESSTYIDSNGREIQIAKGYYTLDEIKELVGENEVVINKNTLKVVFSGKIKGGLAKLYDKRHKLLYMRPNSLYVYIDQLDTSNNYLDGKRSNLLSVIYLSNQSDDNVGDISIFNTQVAPFKKLATTKQINKIDISITDEHGNKYDGRFILDLEFM